MKFEGIARTHIKFVFVRTVIYVWVLPIQSQNWQIDQFSLIIFSDEAYFDLGSYVNMQNCRIWDTENPHAYIEKPTHPKRVTVWCGFMSRGIIGPFFFENEQGEAITVNDDCHQAMLNEFLFTKIEEEDVLNIWFQQDGAKCHTRCFVPCFWRSHYQPQSWCRLATSELRFDTVELLFGGCRLR